MNPSLENNVPAPDDSPGLAAQINSDIQALVARLATFKADFDVLYNLAQGVAMTVDAALPVPIPPSAGALDAIVQVGPPPVVL
ncbi:hypothetical protein [Nocardia sp. NPDC056100]|uniref:hypothetical protein n=1 Tax=Nocardia sp. NPDC056100 TaxID=3345712 RepID=UPI0035D96530